MYYILKDFMDPNQIAMVGVLVAFILTFLGLKFPFPFLPVDQGREYAVNGALSKGKTRGVGLTFVCSFIISCILFMPMTREYVIYCILLFAMMLSGYLDDAAKTPWSDYKKGAIDLVLSIMTVITFLNFNSAVLYIGSMKFTLPVPVYFILAIILLWVSVNVTNCSDGVDGLCGSLCCVVIASFAVMFPIRLGDYVIASLLFVATLLAYLCFNSKPSSMLMGDAGSRALGFFIAILAMKSGHPVLYILLALMLIVDGGLGLVKVFLLRFLKIHILKNTLTPIHDHVRKNKDWSDTQVVFRFTILQVMFAVLAYVILTMI
ncbi:MAG: phospho-N-acetylmuramoyl-pentapeptide-transferase [Lachnospiraceae bacterium]|nr:phospho-N-acetylmuramoyl-pentapeptide-transferase [Lachnospiraceae bacterium]